MVAVKDAVKISLENLGDLFPGETMPDLRLEEVMLSEDETRWTVTVSYKNPDYETNVVSREQDKNGLQLFLGHNRHIPTRLYKTVTLSTDEGRLLGIKNEWEMSND